MRIANPRGRKRDGTPVAVYLAAAALTGGVIGMASVAPSGSAEDIANSARAFAVENGLTRAREPRPGDYWRNCSEAKAAGVAPLQSWEPGYREGLDGDADGEACEPYRGK